LDFFQVVSRCPLDLVVKKSNGQQEITILNINVARMYPADNPSAFKYQLEIPNVNLDREIEVRGKNFRVKKVKSQHHQSLCNPTF
jgi:hypothetical protein